MTRDLFSEQSKEYASYRPTYPPELFNYILSFVEEKKLAWDCATGNGQSAIPLSEHFQKVFASDISQMQLEQAPEKDNIEYIICPAEKTPFEDDSFNLITISQAYHWINWQAFHQEAYRVGKQNCVVAVWMYHLLHSEEEGINKLVHHFYTNITGPYWDAERKHIDDHYSNVQFDFDPLPPQQFSIKAKFTKEHLSGFFASWSATQNFIKANKYSPFMEIKHDLDKIWPQNESKTFRFPLILKLGRIIK